MARSVRKVLRSASDAGIDVHVIARRETQNLEPGLGSDED